MARKYHNVVLFLGMAVLFGGAFPAIKAGLDFFPPLLFATARYLLSAALLLGYAVVTTDDWWPRTQGDRLAVLAGGTFFVGGTGLAFVGQQFTTSGVAAILFALIPILTPLVALFVLPGERLSQRELVGVVVGFVGVGFVVQPDPSAADPGVLGETLIVLAAVSVTLGTVLVRRSHPSMSVVALTGWAMVIGATIQFGFSVALGESVTAIQLTPSAVLTVGYLAVFASGVGFVLYFTLLERFGPLEINLVAYLQPVVAVAVGRIILGEPLTLGMLVGFLVIAAGFALLKNKEIATELARYRGAAR